MRVDLIHNMNELSEEVTRREGGVINLSIAQVKEVLAHLSDISYEIGATQNRVGPMLYANGERRAEQKKARED